MSKNDSDLLRLVNYLLKQNAEMNTPPEWRESLKAGISALLAISLWIFLGWIASSQLQQSKEYAAQIAKVLPTDKDKINLIERAAERVDKTANALYAILTPIATAVTGYFFISQGVPSSRQGLKQQVPELPTSDSSPEDENQSAQNIESKDVEPNQAKRGSPS
jgi:hypothetical protein